MVLLNNERLVTGFGVGTIVGTVFVAPINMAAQIYGFKYTNPLSVGTVGTITVEMRQVRSSTLVGTIDVVTLIPSSPNVRDSIGEIPVGRIEGGDSLVGVITFPTGAPGSIQAVVVYDFLPGRYTAHP